MFKAELISDLPRFMALEKEWTALAERFHTPLLRHEWFVACFKAYGGGKELAVFTVREDGALRAAAPFAKADMMPLLAEAGPFAVTLAAVLVRGDCELKVFQQYERPLLQPGHDRMNYLQNQLGGKRARNLRRRQRRLAELGKVSIVEAKSGNAIESPLDDFLTLEAAGWKGRLGTAAANNGEVHRFMRQMAVSLGGEGKISVHRLMLDGKVIAASIALKSGDVAWGWKVAYDERYAEYSPGVLVVAGMTESLLADPAIVQVDSCVTAGDTMAAQVWNKRVAIADWLFTPGVNGAVPFAVASRLEALRRAASAAVKSVRDHLRGR